MAFDDKTKQAFKILKPKPGEALRRRSLGRNLEHFAVPHRRHALILGPGTGTLIFDARLNDSEAVNLYLSGARSAQPANA